MNKIARLKHAKRVITGGLIGILIIFTATYIIFKLATSTNITSPVAPPGYDFWEELPVTPRPDNQLCWDPISFGYVSSWEEVKSHIPATSGVGGGLGEGDLSDATFVGFHTFEVKPDTRITGNYHLYYPSTESNVNSIHLRYILLLDEQQLLGAINNSLGDYYDVTLNPGDDITLTLNIPPLSPGIHDLIILGLAGAKDEPDPYGVIKHASQRVTLLADLESQPVTTNYTQLPAGGSLEDDDPMISLLLSLRDDYSLTVWNWPDTRLLIPSNEPFDFYIYAGYEGAINASFPNLPPPDWMSFALLTFMDYRQVDVTPGTPILYGKISNDTAYTRITSTIQPPVESGRHDILVLRINYPGVPMCILQGPPDGHIFAYFLSARRVSIESE